MREIDAQEITEVVRTLCIEANKVLPPDLEQKLRNAAQNEISPLGKSVLCDLIENVQQAKSLDLPICQDTGMAVVFAQVGQDVHIAGMGFEDAIQLGVRRGYTEGLLRCSVVGDPLANRVNTGDNTPAVIHTQIVPGDRITLTVAPKGAGSENMSALRMFTPSATRDEIVHYIVNAVEEAGSNPCPPIVVGVGIGGNFEQCALLAKIAVSADTNVQNPNPYYAEMERELLLRINRTGIGPQGFGGTTTALSVQIRTAPTHIASLPVAVSIGCHVTRHKTVTI